MPDGLQHSAPHLERPFGHEQTPLLAIWLPGQLTGVGVGVDPRLAASAVRSARPPAATAPLKPSSPLSSDRRLLPTANDFTSESNRRSSNPKTSQASETTGSDEPVGWQEEIRNALRIVANAGEASIGR